MVAREAARADCVEAVVVVTPQPHARPRSPAPISKLGIDVICDKAAECSPGLRRRRWRRSRNGPGLRLRLPLNDTRLRHGAACPRAGGFRRACGESGPCGPTVGNMAQRPEGACHLHG
jgi:hypothetical protein